jgi:cobalt-zinc-cadmium resistance protein CzcA
VINHYIEVYKEIKDKEKATFQTIKDKFRSILMVGLVASIGLLPAAVSRGVGSQVQKPLAIVVVGGMLIGTCIILIIVPLLFKYVQIKD